MSKAGTGVPAFYLYLVLGAGENVILEFLIQFAEIAAPAPHADNKTAVILRVFLGIQQDITVQRIQLQLMTAAENE